MGFRGNDPNSSLPKPNQLERNLRQALASFQNQCSGVLQNLSNLPPFNPPLALKTQLQSTFSSLQNQAKRALDSRISTFDPVAKNPVWARVAETAKTQFSPSPRPGIALSTETIEERLAGIPVYALSNAAEEFVLVSGSSTAKSLGLFCFKKEDAEALLEHIGMMDPSAQNGSKVVPVALNKAFQLHVNGVAFRLIPECSQVKYALTEREKAGISADRFSGVPVFQSKSLILRSQNKSYRPAFFRKEDLVSSLQRASREQNQINPALRPGDIQVAVFEEIIKGMKALIDESEHKTKFKGFVMAATRKHRFEKVTKELKVTRIISTLVDEIKAINDNRGEADFKCTNVMAPVTLSQRSPVLLLMGGGMGAGKSTVLKAILKEPFWSEAEAKAVVVEADAFKETDVVYKAINSMGCPDDMLQTSELVHQSSTNAASSLLVTALNEGRDVIMDGTLSWEPYVEQTVQMARNVHNYRYRMGVGYKVAEDGTVIENYWEQMSQDQEQQYDFDEKVQKDRKPYRIELVGVVCDAHLAVIRGIRRAVMVGRAVRVKSQLKSHKRFAKAFTKYCKLVDNARLYSTNVMGRPPKLIGWKNGDNKLLVDTEEIKCVSVMSSLKENAVSVYELYQDASFLSEPGSLWKDTVMSSSRASFQMELKASIQSIESK